MPKLTWDVASISEELAVELNSTLIDDLKVAFQNEGRTAFYVPLDYAQNNLQSHLYGTETIDEDVVMGTFPVVKRKTLFPIPL